MSLAVSGRYGLLGFPFSAQTLKTRMAKGPALDPRSVPGCRISLTVLTSACPFLHPSPAPSALEASFRLQVRGCSLDLYPEMSRRGAGRVCRVPSRVPQQAIPLASSPAVFPGSAGNKVCAYSAPDRFQLVFPDLASGSPPGKQVLSLIGMAHPVLRRLGGATLPDFW